MVQTSSYTVTGMTCGHCVASVTEEVHEVPEVDEVEVTLETGELVISSATGINPDAVRAAVESAGYQLA